jgi:hypothetical protein
LLTAQAGGYRRANNVQSQDTEKFYNETADAFANIMVTPDKELFSTLINTNFTLTGQLTAKDKFITALQSQLRNNKKNNYPAPAHRQVSASGKTNVTVGLTESKS